MKFDLHLHTTRYSPDSAMEPDALLQRALEIGLEGVVITEHDYLWPEPELDELRGKAPGLVVLAGIEVSAREGHFLVYGVNEPHKLPRGIRVAELCREVHRQGGVVVAAHPFRWGQRFDDILRNERPELDGLELMTKNMDEDCRQRAASIHAGRQLAGMGSSDAHHEDELGFCFTEFGQPVRDARDLIDAIRHRRVSPRERGSDGRCE